MTRLVLSQREAAELLHVDRSRTLPALIKAGIIHTVPWGGRVRISLEEIQRIAREGIPSVPLARSRPHRRCQGAPDAEVGQRIRRLPHGKAGDL